MDRQEFSLLVARLERDAEDHPGWYTAKVAAVAALGYLVIALLAFAILATGWHALAPLFSGGPPRPTSMLAALFGSVTLAAVVRVLWVKLDGPTGRPLERAEAPRLFTLIDQMCEAVGGVPVHSVTLTGEFDAGISQIPRWGVFGNYRNHLVIGLPLLIALDTEEFQAVLAHELGHLSGHHGKFKSWIYRQRRTWHALEARFAEPRNGLERLLAYFYGWYAPYFQAYSFVLARKHEYDADQVAAYVTNDRSIASALIKVDLVGRFLEEVFWPRLYSQLERSPEPPYPPYSLMHRAYKVAEKQWACEEWLTQALRRLATPGDTHPSLTERLAALAIEPMLPTYDTGRSALALLAPSAASLVKHFDEEWLREYGPQWREQHEALKQTRAKLRALERHPDSELSAEQLWEKATLLLEVDATEAAIEALGVLVARPEPAPRAHMLLAQLLLERGEDRGLDHLLLVAQQDKEMALDAARAGYAYLEQRGRRSEANRFWTKMQEAQAA
ncbi:MAG: hypothetical protein DIU71_05490 [Proteobacteria bacterium]|nr:MAG: hypothetical protein DIU71_05490 [Pseudomonadota bacterium]